MDNPVVAPSRVVTLHYTLTDASGRTLDDSKSRRQPLDYLHGHGNLFPALEAAMLGAEPGERVTATLAAAEAYGERDEALVSESPRSAFGGDTPLEPGHRFQAQGPEGPRTVTLVSVADSHVVVDANHPLAGKELSYALEIEEVREATRAELAKGHPLPPGTSHTEVEDRKQS
ncbi:FKBP-type peptidyl-prolyl cis-trans isomerase [Salinicola aestuarinus]|uniref:FKBP-type peptidyl-prolyl cis-trans isomerase n=1 Tax=Salinicola aestuarinus TaxID=1949082 RepID=UPI000DA1CE11|nr:peptidylprolyl isomerase [Salinicola aestuarinus]